MDAFTAHTLSALAEEQENDSLRIEQLTQEIEWTEEAICIANSAARAQADFISDLLL